MHKSCPRLFSLILIVLMFLSLFSLPVLASEEAFSVAESVLETVETASAEESAPALTAEETAPAVEAVSTEEPVSEDDAPVLSDGAAPTTHDELAAALAAGGEIVLGGDIELTGTLSVPAGVSVVLDLNGHAVSAYKFTAIDVSGDLTILDSVGTGSVITDRNQISSSYFTITTQSGSSLTITGGSFSGSGVLNAYESAVTISGGTFTQNATSNTYLLYFFDCTAEISGGTFCNLSSDEYGGCVLGTVWSEVTISGGAFEENSPVGIFDFLFADVTFNGGSFSAGTIDLSTVATLSITGGNFVADSMDLPSMDISIDGGTFVVDSMVFPSAEVTINGGTFVVDSMVFPSTDVTINGGTFRTSSGDPQPDVIEILPVEYYLDEEGTPCYQPLPDTAEELNAALAAGGEVVLGRDVALTETLVVPAGSEAVLELNGYALTAWDFTLLDVRGKLTVRDSVGTGSMHATFVDDPDDPYERCYTITSQAGAVLIIESGSFSGGQITLEPKGGDITVNGGTFFGSKIPLGGENCTMTVNGGVFQSSGTFLFAPEYSDVTINGGTFEYTGSGNMSHVYYSTITINGGTFSGGIITCSWGEAMTVTGGTFTIDRFRFPENASVTGGVFNVLEIDRWILVDSVTIEYTGEPFITGGTFLDHDGAVLSVDEHIVDGYYQDENGTVQLRIIGGGDPTTSPAPTESPVPTEEPQPSAKPETSPKPQTTSTPASTVPATGDDSPAVLWAWVLVLCAAAMCLPVRALGKKR